MPGSLQVSSEGVALELQYRLAGEERCHKVSIPRELFSEEEQGFEVSEYPHRELLTRTKDGLVFASTLLANHFHLIPGLDPEVANLKILYVGKGLHNSARDRLKHHETLQEILEQINSNDPDSEVFALMYAFELKKHVTVFAGPTEITGERAKRHNRDALAYRPSLDEQIALVEASCIAYFKTSVYNSQYLEFPKETHRILRDVLKADFASLSVNLDNGDIGSLRIYSGRVVPSEFHHISINFRGMRNE